MLHLKLFLSEMLSLMLNWLNKVGWYDRLSSWVRRSNKTTVNLEPSSTRMLLPSVVMYGLGNMASVGLIPTRTMLLWLKSLLLSSVVVHGLGNLLIWMSIHINNIIETTFLILLLEFIMPFLLFHKSSNTTLIIGDEICRMFRRSLNKSIVLDKARISEKWTDQLSLMGRFMFCMSMIVQKIFSMPMMRFMHSLSGFWRFVNCQLSFPSHSWRVRNTLVIVGHELGITLVWCFHWATSLLPLLASVATSKALIML